MLNITVSDSNAKCMDKTITVINKVLVNYDIDYRIHKFSGLNNKKNRIRSGEFKIYILDVSSSEGMAIASKIRENDLDSIIILTANCEDICNKVVHNKIMAFEVICKDRNYRKCLMNTLNLALDVYFKHKLFIFSYNHIIYRIPYDEINYIEKEPLIKRCIIHTINSNYYVVNSIANLEGILGSNFVKTHQSCLANVDNISEIDSIDNLIVFKNETKTHLLTDKMKRKMREYITSH